jgi:hypothetical protein
MAGVKIVSGPGVDAPKPQPYAEIKDQGRIPYPQVVDEKTPDTTKVKVVKGKSRGMGAALRGGNFTID